MARILPRIKFVLFFWGLLPVFALGVTSPEATEIKVQPGWASLRLANLGAVSGDTLTLAPGLYSDDHGVLVKGGVTIRSSDGPFSTIVALEKGTDVGVFLITNASPPPRIEGLTIAHGSWHNGFVGGGIRIESSSPIIENNLIVGNVDGDIEGAGGLGCGIGVEGGSPIIRHNTIVRNACDYGAIDLYLCSAIVEYNVIADNLIDSARGRGISCDSSPAAIIRDNLFWNNPGNISVSCDPMAQQNNVVADPQFCRVVPSPQDPLNGDWRVAMTSPVAPGGAQSGWGASLGMCPGTTPAAQRTWGQIKATYR